MHREQNFTVNVDDAIRDLGIPVQFLLFKDLRIKKNNAALDNFQQFVFEQLQSELTNESLKNNDIINGYKELRTLIGLSRQKYVASPEALLKLLMKKGELPRINILVDLYNTLSVKTCFSMGAHDVEYIDDNRLSFRLTNGNELFLPMGATEPCSVPSGEYAYIDGANEILCRLDHRQCHKTRVTEKTNSCILIIQGNQSTSEQQITQAREELISLVQQFCGGEYEILAV